MRSGGPDIGGPKGLPRSRSVADKGRSSFPFQNAGGGGACFMDDDDKSMTSVGAPERGR